MVRDGPTATVLRQRAALITRNKQIHRLGCVSIFVSGYLSFSLLRVLWWTSLVVGDEQLLESEIWSFQ